MSRAFYLPIPVYEADTPGSNWANTPASAVFPGRRYFFWVSDRIRCCPLYAARKLGRPENFRPLSEESRGVFPYLYSSSRGFPIQGLTPGRVTCSKSTPMVSALSRLAAPPMTSALLSYARHPLFKTKVWCGCLPGRGRGRWARSRRCTATKSLSR
jgi:hypothetical protein